MGARRGCGGPSRWSQLDAVLGGELLQLVGLADGPYGLALAQGGVGGAHRRFGRDVSTRHAVDDLGGGLGGHGLGQFNDHEISRM